MDLHFWKDCPMLAECLYCKQVIEVESLNPHLLTECEKKDEFKECARCKESVHRDTYEEHVADK